MPRLLSSASSSYKTVVYLGAKLVLALIAVLLTTLCPEHPISWVLAFMAFWGTLGGLFYAYAADVVVPKHIGLHTRLSQCS